MRKTLTAILGLGMLASTASAQQTTVRTDLALNVLIHGTVGALGAHNHDKSAVQGFRSGAIGGGVIALSKYCIGRNEDCAWPGRIGASIGTSIVYNTAMGKPATADWKVEIESFSVQLRKDGKFTAYAQIQPSAIATLGYSLFAGHLDVGSSVRYGIPVFRGQFSDHKLGVALDGTIKVTDDLHAEIPETASCVPIGTYLHNSQRMIESSCKVTQYTAEYLPGNIVSHELLHTLQRDEDRVLLGLMPSLIVDKIRRLENRSHLDLEPLATGAIDLIQFALPYRLRPSEIEAYTLSGNRVNAKVTNIVHCTNIEKSIITTENKYVLLSQTPCM